MAGDPDDWESAKLLIKGALKKVEKLQTRDGNRGEGQGPSDSLESTAGTGAESSTRSRIDEFRKLFGYRPGVSDKSATKRPKSNRSRPAKVPKISYWKKEAMCLRYTDQQRGPDTSEKMALAKLGLGVKELCFDPDGDALHVHSVIRDAFKQLEDSGGYTLMRLAANSTDLITIEVPKGGMTVQYLKDILKKARLFIRPLQCDIADDNAEGSGSEVCFSSLRFV